MAPFPVHNRFYQEPSFYSIHHGPNVSPSFKPSFCFDPSRF